MQNPPTTQSTFNRIEGSATDWIPPSEDDSDAGDDYDGEVDGLDSQWDMLNRGLWDFNALTIAIRQRYLTEVCKLPPQAALKNLEDLPWRAAPKQRTYGGRTEFYEYIPLWTDPEFETDRKNGSRYFQGSLLNRLYPAQTEESLAKDPTEMAKRYGIHPDRTDGRSRLSPEDSASRRYQLKNGDWVDAGDLDRFLEEHYFMSEIAQASNQSIENYIEVQAQKTATTEEEQTTLEMWQLCQKHNAELKKDADYQRFVFHGYTTDELQKLGVLDFSSDVYFDLKGPVHPILAQNRWLPAPVHAGTKTLPRQYYVFKDKNQIRQTGQWTARDPLIWDALQPALQLLTRILNSNVPAWTGLLDLYTRLRVDLDLDPLADLFRDEEKKGSACNCRNAWHTEAHPFSTKSFPELLKLSGTGFNSSDWTKKVVAMTLQFKIESCNRFAGDNDPDHLRGTFGFTSMRVRNNKAYSTVSIGAELIWPLLSIHTSNAEKRTCSFAVASILLHEIAHAIVMAQGSAVDHKPSLNCVADPGHRDLLHRACLRLFSHLADDPFFEDEPTAEAGFALENQVFGGVLTHALRSSSDLQPVPVHMIMTQISSNLWPFARRSAWIRPTKTTKQLFSPPQPMLDVKRAIPSDTMAKVFSQSFWDKDFARYGPESLKIQGDRVLKRPPLAPPIVGSHWNVYGPKRGFFMMKAHSTLRKSGYNTIATYMESRARQRGMGIATRRLWHYEHKTWPGMSKDLDQAAKEIRKAAAKYLPLFEDAVLPETKQRDLYAKQHPIAPGTNPSVSFEAWIQNVKQYRSHSFSYLAGKLKKLHRLLITRFEYTQSMLCTLTTLELADREKIRQKHFGRLVNVLHYVPFRLASKVDIALRSLGQLYRLRIGSLRQESGPQLGDSALQIRLQEDMADLKKQQTLFRTLEGMFRNHLGPPTSNEYSGDFWGPEKFIAVTSLNLATEPEVFFEAVHSDLNRLKDPDVIRIVDEVFKILKAFERSNERAPSPASSLASTAPPPSPRGGSGSGSDSQPQPGDPSTDTSKTQPKKRAWLQTAGGTDASGNETGLPPTKRVQLLDKESDAPSVRDTQSCANNRKAFEASNQATMDLDEPPTDLNTNQPPPPGMIAFPDPKTGFTQYAPVSRAADVGPMLQQAAQEREASAAQARQALVDLEARSHIQKRMEGPPTAEERAALLDLQSQETDLNAFRLKEKVIRAFEAIRAGPSGQDEDVEMQI
ncbi:uncharacterized protein PgNI_07269 [Pyricularia grisea]|uniref:Uncharacterized protein n=1 Tax=Pyricularia grisea TaxID=148305 RepID=A0A6P8B379_PYRGI|nr:uncharacterized protein PgNI_07269 [Pyricularia grisea]TLD09264.1 hypothetical protein PgNI_07269 [Pyricularia grisea]